jgi:triacylglycerol lipase
MIDTRHLVAPELTAGLDVLPDTDFSQGPEVYRAGFDTRQIPPMPPGLEVVAREDRMVPGPDGAPDVRVLVYSPPGQARGPRPAVLHIHGGGYVIGAADINDISNRAHALTHDCVVVSVDYRLAPETTWPGALEDCYAALCWLAGSADAPGVDTARIAVAGESAGGGHAVALAIHARNRARDNPDAPSLCFQLLDAPMLDDRTGTGTNLHPYVGQFVWTAEKNRYGWTSLLGVEAGGAGVREEMVPARCTDLSGLPPAFVSVGALDLFLEEDIEYVRRLTRAGIAAEFYVVPGAYHGFGAAGMSPQLETLSGLRRNALARAFATA